VIATKAVEVEYMLSFFSLFEAPALRMRYGSIPSGMRALSHMRGPLAERLRACVAIYTFIRMFDHIIDPGDLAPEAYAAPEQYVEQASWMIVTLRNPELIADETAFPVMAGLVYAYRVCRELLGIDPTDQMNYIWELYTPDVERMLAGEVFTNRCTMEAAFEAYDQCVVLALWIMNVPIRIARKVVGLSSPLKFADPFNDFLYDLEAGNVQLPIEEFDEAGIDLEMLLKCETWEDLALLPGFAVWFTAFAARTEAQWLAAQPEAVALLKAHMKSRLVRYVMRRKYRQLGRNLSEARRRFTAMPAPAQGALAREEARN